MIQCSSPPQPAVNIPIIKELISELTQTYADQIALSKRVQIEVAWQKQGQREFLEQRLRSDPAIGRLILSTCAQNLQSFIHEGEWTSCRKNVIDKNRGKYSTNVPSSFPNSHVEMIHIGFAARLVQLFIGAGKNQKASTIPEENYFNMAGNLVQVITRQVCEVVQQNHSLKNNVRPLSEEDKVGQVAQFSAHLFIRIMNPLCASHPMLLPHTWRGFCEITSFLQKTNRRDEDCLVFAVDCLHKFLEEGVGNMVSILLSKFEQIKLSKHMKILIFFTARLFTLLPILLKGTRCEAVKSIISDFSGLTTLLLKLRGMSLIIPALTDVMGITLEKEDKKNLSKQVSQLSLKAEQCLCAMIFHAEDAENPAQNNNTYFHTLINLPLFNENDACNQTKKADRFIESALCLGKFLMIFSIMSKFLSSCPNMTGGVSSPIHNIIDSESVLDICEELLYRILPACHACITLSSSHPPWNGEETELLTLSSQAIDKIVCCVMKCEGLKSDGCSTNRANQMHFLLARWLCPVINGTSNISAPLHPFSREIILAVVQIYIVRSIVGKQCNVSTSSKRLVYLLAKLLFEPRTITRHRENIGILFFRLVLSSEKVHKITIHLLCRELKSSAIHEDDINGIKEGRKRSRRVNKRKSTFETLKYWSSADLQAISPLLELLSFDETFLREMESQIKEHVSKSFAFVGNEKKRNTSTHLLLLLHNGLAVSRGYSQTANVKMVDAVLTAFADLCKSSDSSLTSKNMRIHLLRFLFVSFAVLKNPISQQNLELLSYGLENCLHHTKCHKIDVAVASILQQIGHLSGTEPQNRALSSVISSYFHSKLRSGNTGKIAVMMAAIEKFAPTLSAQHRSILPSCVPAQRQGLLQSRFKGETFSFHLGEPCEIDIHKQFQWVWTDRCILIKCTSVMNVIQIRKLNHSSSDVLIESGSKILRLNSGNNSVAYAYIVIPPSDECEKIENIVSSAFNSKKVKLLGSVSKVIPTSNRSDCRLKITNLDDNKAKSSHDK